MPRALPSLDKRLHAPGTLVPGPQKDSVLEELERLTEGLEDKARASHDPALGLAVGMNEARRQQQLTRRMMATVSELSLYQVRGAGVDHVCVCAGLLRRVADQEGGGVKELHTFAGCLGIHGACCCMCSRQSWVRKSRV